MKSVIKLGAYQDTILPFIDCEKELDLLTIDNALNRIFSAKRTDNVETLVDLLDDEGLAIIYCRSFFYDVYEKMKIFEDGLKLKVLLIDNAISPVVDAELNAVKANMVDVINYIKARKNQKNILFFSVHPLWRLVLLQLMRAVSSDIKIVVYMYDWINIFCPYKHRDLFQKSYKLPLDYVESEYKVLNAILKGEIVNGIIHKDGGEDFLPLADCPLPKLFLPASLPCYLHVRPAEMVKNPDKFVFLGKIYSPLNHLPDLFDDVFLCDVFDDIAGQGFFIDVYYVSSPKETVDYYKKHFMNSERVTLTEGAPLNELLPGLAGKFHWGWMIYRSDFTVVRNHIETSLPSKVFAYLALGLPIVISEELNFAADFIRDNGIGVVVTKRDILNLHDRLQTEDYYQLQRNVLAFREKSALERHKQKFVDLCHQVLSKVN